MGTNHNESQIARRAHQRRAQREAFLRAQLEPGERVVAHHGAVMVTDRRVLFAWNLHRAPGAPSWFFDGIAFEEVARWSLGHRHDERPLLHLEHPTHVRIERVPAHTLLWFQWGNAEAEVPHDNVTLAFGGKRDEAFRATVNRLQHMNTPRGEDFLVAIPGTREERTRGSRALTVVASDRHRGCRFMTQLTSRTRSRRSRLSADEFSGNCRIQQNAPR